MKRKCLLLAALLVVLVPLSGRASGGGVLACLRQCIQDNPCDPGDQACGDFVREICQCQCQGICP